MFKEIKSDATIDDVRKKINTLRSNYRKILKKIEDSKCWVFHGLNFLAEYEKPQASQSSIVKKDKSQYFRITAGPLMCRNRFSHYGVMFF